MNVSLRYLRRKLTDAGLMPRSRLAYFALLMLSIELLLILFRGLFLLFTRAGSEIGSAANAPAPLGGWITFLTFVNGILFAALALRWMRSTLMWRLRNRLIVTYLFIGVIPVGLIAAIVLLSGYLIAAQFAIFMASYDIHVEVDNLQQANAEISGRLADAARRGVPLSQPGILQENLAALSKDFPRLQVTATFKGKSETFGMQTKRASSKPPGWITSQYGGLVADADRSLHLRTVTLTSVGNDVLAVEAEVPVDAPELSRISKNLGEISLGDNQLQVTENGENQEFTLKEKKGANEENSKRAATRARGGSVPAAINFLDLEFPFGGLLGILDWQTGKKDSLFMMVRTRMSVLYQRLFLSYSEQAALIKTALFGIGIFFALIELVALIIGLRLTRTITRSVAALYRGTECVNRGDFRHRIEVKTRDQLAALETSFNSMTTSLEALIAEQKEKQRLESELAIAQEVQAQLFPRESVQLHSLELHGICRPARTVSGDYYDFLPITAERLALAVGDISGKGISAALLMATIHSAVRVYEFGGMPDQATLSAASATVGALAPGNGGRLPVAGGNGIHSPREVLWLLNRHLFHTTPAEKYATLFLGVYDGASRTLTYSNAGHLPPLLIGEDGGLRKLDAGGTVIGLFEEISHDESAVQLRSGDLLVAYSDGITEPENEFGEFGEARLLELLRENRRLPLSQLSERVITAVLDWTGGAEQPDDVTLVLARAR